MKRPRTRTVTLALTLILFLSVVLNVVGNSWGIPDRWHPDELDPVAAALVAQKTLNPHFFPYGGLQYYVIAAFAAIPVGVYNHFLDPKPREISASELASWRERKDARVHVMARFVSGMMATLTVLFAYWIGLAVFDEWTALGGAVLLAVSPYFVLIAHLSTVDAGANFWYWLSCLLSLAVWKRGARRWMYVAGFAVGLAAGTKLDHGIAIIPLLVAHTFVAKSVRDFLLRAAVSVLLASCGYVVANPTLLLSFYEFADGTAKELIFNMLRGNGEASFTSMLHDMRQGMGPVTVGLAAVGLAFLLRRAASGDLRREAVWLLSTALPMYLIFGSRYSVPWYSVCLFPALAVIAGYALVSLWQVRPPYTTVAAITALVAASGLALVQTAAEIEEFRHDSRYLAAEWISAHAASGSQIAISHRGPWLSSKQFAIHRLPISPEYYADSQDWRGQLEESKLYQRVHVTLARWQGADADRPAYRGWFERVADLHDKLEVVQADFRPGYWILLDYLDEPRILSLRTAGSGYELVAVLHYVPSFGSSPHFPFINPVVYIYAATPANAPVASGVEGKHRALGQ